MFASSRSRSCTGVAIPPGRHTGTAEEESVARRGQRQSGRSPHAPAKPAARPRPRQRGHHPGARPRRARGRGRGPARSGQPSVRTKFQVVALLVREERARVKADDTSWPRRTATEQLKRLDGVATILAKTAARDTSLLAAARRGRRRLRRGHARSSARCCRRPASRRPPEEARAVRARRPTPGASDRRVVPQSVDLAPAGQPVPRPRLRGCRQRSARPRRAGWPAGSCSARCFRSFEYAGSRRARACMALPEPSLAARARRTRS